MALSRFVARITLAAAFAAVLGGSDPVMASPQEGGVIKIVSSMPRTGESKGQTDTVVNGIKMAIDEVGGKVGAYTIVYEDLDDATAAAGDWTPEKEAANAEAAIKDADVMVYIGTFNSGAAKISIPKLNQANLLMISPANTNPCLTKPGKGEADEPQKYRKSGKINYCRVVPTDDVQGPVGAEWAKKLGLNSVYILDDRQVYGKGIADLFHARAEEIGLKILGHEGIDPKAPEFKALMTKIKAANPDLIYFGGMTSSKGGQIAKDIVAGGLGAKLMVPDGCYEEEFIKSAGAANLNDRCYVTFPGLPPEKMTGKGKVFVDGYVKKYNAPPQAFAVYGYECAKVAIEAIKLAGKKDRDVIRAAAVATKNFDGALGHWSFDKNGDTTLKTFSGQVVKDGKFTFMAILGEED